jgi:hypothetical protein
MQPSENAGTPAMPAEGYRFRRKPQHADRCHKKILSRSGSSAAVALLSLLIKDGSRELRML